jgi:hypothetical protein
MPFESRIRRLVCWLAHRRRHVGSPPCEGASCSVVDATRHCGPRCPLVPVEHIPLPLARPGLSFHSHALHRPNRVDIVVADGAHGAMARKKSTVAMANKKRPVRVGRTLLSSKLPLPAHSRLIHGFLVKLPTGSTAPAGSAHPASVESASFDEAPQRDADPKHEGPAEGATFH